MLADLFAACAFLLWFEELWSILVGLWNESTPSVIMYALRHLLTDVCCLQNCESEDRAHANTIFNLYRQTPVTQRAQGGQSWYTSATVSCSWKVIHCLASFLLANGVITSQLSLTELKINQSCAHIQQSGMCDIASAFVSIRINSSERWSTK